MYWYWKVRIYDENGHYYHCQVKTNRELEEIDTIQDCYYAFTGCKMILEGMDEREYEHVCGMTQAFYGLWKSKSNKYPSMDDKIAEAVSE